MPPIPTPRRELLAAGLTAARIDGDLRKGATVAPFRGVHVDSAAAMSWRMRVRAATATQAPTAVAGMQTAAALHQLRWLPDAWLSDNALVHFVVPRDDSRRHRQGIKLHRRQLRPKDTVMIDGIACLSATRTLVEIARDGKLAPLLVVQIIDGALRDGRTTRAELLECLSRLRGERGVARARELVSRAREEVDSPQETRLRLMLEDGGISRLDVNIKIYDDEGFVLARGDLGNKELLLWGEYDGFVPHTDRETFRSDRPRHRWLNRRGWYVMRFADVDLARPRQVCREWLVAAADAPARIAALDPALSPEVGAARKALGFD